MAERIVVALGGNALGNTPYEQLKLVEETARPIVDLIAQGNQVVIACFETKKELKEFAEYAFAPIAAVQKMPD